MRDPRERVRDMLEAVANIERYTHRGREALEHDELLQTWFLRNLEILGEAARAVPDSVRALAPQIPWSSIVGMRNVLVHGYFQIDTDLVWEAVYRDVPALRPQLEALLAALETQQ